MNLSNPKVGFHRYRGILTLIVPRKFPLLPRNRGLACGWLIIIRKPDRFGLVRSTTGFKTLRAVLRHEHTHCVRQTEDGIFGFIKWVYKYYTDEKFHQEEERIAVAAE